MAIALEKSLVFIPKSLEISWSDSTLTPLWTESNKGKHPPEKTEATDQKKNAKLCV